MVHKNNPHINHALVEEKRPPMYTAMKYWGKKPHNIWSEFINRYCPKEGVVLDPFAGSGISALEAAKLGRRAIAFDLNPLTSFTIEVLTSKFDESKFQQAFSQISSSVENDAVYQKHFTKQVDGRLGIIFNYRWKYDEVVKLAIEIPKSDSEKAQRFTLQADEEDKENVANISTIEIPYWFPKDSFPDSPSITHKFVSDIGGDQFQYLWTRRNLYLLSLIFSKITSHPDKAIKLQLLYGFIQTLHLCSKMIVPRSPASKREFSGSWGRADYMIRERQMEQNPLIVFRRSCIEKQSVLSAMKDAMQSLPRNLKVVDFASTKKINKRVNLTYGTVDIADLSKYISDRSVDFIITDPPYAGLVQYLDLSLLWLVWLQQVDKKYKPDLQSEITIKKGIIGRDEYRQRLQNAFRQMHRVLKDEGYLVVTFHHKKLAEWNDFRIIVK